MQNIIARKERITLPFIARKIEGAIGETQENTASTKPNVILSTLRRIRRIQQTNTPDHLRSRDLSGLEARILLSNLREIIQSPREDTRRRSLRLPGISETAIQIVEDNLFGKHT